MEAERDMDTPCTEASTTLSASQSLQSTPAFYRGSDLRRRLSIPESMNMGHSSHLCPIELGGLAPLIRLGESPLAAMSQLAPTKSLKRLRRHQSKANQSPSDGQAIGARAVKGVKGQKALTLDPRGIQTATGQPQEEPVTPEQSACSRRLQRRITKNGIKQGMRELKEGILMSGTQRLEQPYHPVIPSRVVHQQTGNSLPITPDKSNVTKQPAYIPTTITTGCNHQMSPSGYRQEVLQDNCLLPRMARLDESRYKAPTAKSLGHSLGNIHTNQHMRTKQSIISSAEGESVGERQAGITYREEVDKTQLAEDCLRNKRLRRLAMLAQDSSSLRRSTSIQDRILRATTPCKKPLIRSQGLQELMPEGESDSAGDQTQMHDRLEKRRCPENRGEDDIEDRLQKGRNLNGTDAIDTRSEDEDGFDSEEQEQAAGLKHLLEGLETLGRLYWSAVWPIFDPGALRVEHEGPMPFWKACLSIALAVPAVAAGFVVAVQGVRLVIYLVWLMSYVDDGLAVWA